MERAAKTVADQIIAALRGDSPPPPFDGKDSCYIELGDGAVGKVDADFLSFSTALDNMATVLGLDGWQIEVVRSAVVVGVNPEQGVAAFQITAQVRQKSDF